MNEPWLISYVCLAFALFVIVLGLEGSTRGATEDSSHVSTGSRLGDGEDW